MKYNIALLLSILYFSAFAQKDYHTSDYYTVFDEITLMLENNAPTFKDAVYLVENVYLNNQLQREWFEKKIQSLAYLADAKRNFNSLDYDLADKEKMEKCASLFSVIKDTTTIILQEDTIYHYPYIYDFNDMFGDNDWKNMFVSKLLATQKGNCHSLPYLYKIVADEIGIGKDTYLAVSPNHTYIKHHSIKTGWYNTELTSGFFPQDAWLKASGYIPLTAIKSGIFMMALSDRESIALTLIDLAMGYDRKYPDNDGSFILQCCETALAHFPNCIKALLLRAETYTKQWERIADKESQEAKDLWQKMDTLYGEIHELGYRQMPKSMYVQWLTDVEKAKYENQDVPKGELQKN